MRKLSACFIFAFTLIFLHLKILAAEPVPKDAAEREARAIRSIGQAIEAAGAPTTSSTKSITPVTTSAPTTTPAEPPVMPAHSPRRNADGSLATIKVGVIVSHFSATANTWMGPRRGFGYVSKAMRDGLGDKSFDLYPIIEPNTANDEIVAKFLKEILPQHPPIECTDKTAMAELDVIAAPFVCNATKEMLDAVELAVRERGTGLFIRAWFGTMSPEYTPQVLALNGIDEGQFGWNPRDVTTTVIHDHPIVSALEAGTKMKIEPNGAYGILHGTPLIGVPDMSAITPLGTNKVDTKPNWTFSPLFVASLGKGRIVNFAVLGHSNDPATSNAIKMITIRSIQWLAGQLAEKSKDL